MGWVILFGLRERRGCAAAAKGELRVTVDKGKDVEHRVEKLAVAVQGANVTRDKMIRLLETVSASNQTFDVWLAIVDEILLLIDAEQAGTVAVSQKLATAGFGMSEQKRIVARFSIE